MRMNLRWNHPYVCVVIYLYCFLGGQRCYSYSVGPEFFWHSNYELVKMADDIVLAKAEQKVGEHFVRFKVLSSLKNKYKGKEIVGFGYLDKKLYRGASAKGDFSNARPGAYTGMGNAYDYLKGKQYLLFLKKQKNYIGRSLPLVARQEEGDKYWQIGVQSLSRDKEEVSDNSDPWLATVKVYVKIASMQNYAEEKKALKKLLSLSGNADLPEGLLDDIRRHFTTISPKKSYVDLMSLRKKSKDENIRKRCLLAMIVATYPEAYDLVIREFPNHRKYFFTVDHPKRSERWIDIFKEMKTESQKRHALNLLLPNVRAKEEGDILMQLIQLIDQKNHSGELLALWIEKNPNESRIKALKECIGEGYSEKWRMSASLARLNDEDILDWAIGDVDSKDYFVPTYIIGYSSLPKAYEAAKRIVDSGDSKRIETLRYAIKNQYNKSSNREKIIKLLNSAEKTKNGE